MISTRPPTALKIKRSRRCCKYGLSEAAIVRQFWAKHTQFLDSLVRSLHAFGEAEPVCLSSVRLVMAVTPRAHLLLHQPSDGVSFD